MTEISSCYNIEIEAKMTGDKILHHQVVDLIKDILQ